METADRLYWLKYDEQQDSYRIAVQVGMAGITGAAYQPQGLNRQIQLHLGDNVLAFHIIGSALVDTKATEAIYNQLVGGGVASVAPMGWIDMSEPTPRVMVVPVSR